MCVCVCVLVLAQLPGLEFESLRGFVVMERGR